MRRRALLGLALASPAAAQRLAAMEIEATAGEPCDRGFRVGDGAGQRKISPRGRAQSRRIAERLAELRVSVQFPIFAGPVYRARDTAEAAWGAARVQVTDSLLADDFSGARLGRVPAEHRRLFTEPLPPGMNRVLVGHRTPAIMIIGDAVAGRAFPEGAALVLEPGATGFRLLGIVEPAPVEGGGFHGC